MTKSIAYFDHQADTGIIGRGKTLEESFEAAAEAVFSIMTELSKIKPIETIKIEFDETDVELALVTWINHLLAQARTLGVVFSQFKLKKTNSHWSGVAAGAPWQEQTVRGTEVKGATLTMLEVKQKNNYWEARCVVDV